MSIERSAARGEMGTTALGAPAPVLRPAARVLLIDARDRVLLFRGCDPAQPDRASYWFTVGGGLDHGESDEQAAVREAYEETGLRLTTAELVGPVWDEVAEFRFEGRAYRQPQVFFVARVDAWEVDTAAFAAAEVRSINGHRWWSAAELDSTDEVFYPRNLAALLRRALSSSRNAV